MSSKSLIFLVLAFLTILAVNAEESLPEGMSKKCLLNPNCIALSTHCNGSLKKWISDKREPTKEEAHCMCAEDFEKKLKACADGSWVTPSCPEAKQALEWKHGECKRVLSGERKFKEEL